MAELQRFQAVPSERLRHHAIDMHLHRYPQAVENLFAAGPEHFGKVRPFAWNRLRGSVPIASPCSQLDAHHMNHPCFACALP